jgi:hypothetical protein
MKIIFALLLLFALVFAQNTLDHEALAQYHLALAKHHMALSKVKIFI